MPAPRPSQVGGPVPGGQMSSGAISPTLPKAPLPFEQLNQLQRRMAHLLNSINELQEHVLNAQTLDEWPALLSRHLTIVSQTHSLSQFLSLANPNTLNAQLAKRDEILVEDALQSNKFSTALEDFQDGQNGVGGFGVSNDALFGGKKSGEKGGDVHENDRTTNDGPKLAKVSFSDGEKNPIRKVVPHPFFPLDAEKAQTIVPSLLMPRGSDVKVLQDSEKRWQDWIKENTELNETINETNVKREWIETLRQQIFSFDDFASKALRSWVHAREATDELGQRYDWKMRLAPDEDSDEGEMMEEEEDVEMKEGGDEALIVEDRKRKRGQEEQKDNNPLSLKQVQQFLKSGPI